jgi:uncharacterized protein YbbC (DUF1343 family)
MLRGLDLLVFDIQDLAVRCYTYVSTLQYVLEAAAEAGIPVVVADRPVPLPRCVDGPVTEPGVTSFVSRAPFPLCYAMTPGEAAGWLNAELDLGAQVRIARLRGYRREPGQWPAGRAWIPPSPGIPSLESALCYPATVFAEALTPVDCGRRTSLPFQLLGAAFTRSGELAERLSAARLPGLRWYPHVYAPDPGRPSRVVQGVRLVVTAPARYRPARTAVTTIAVLQELYGRERVWPRSAERRAFVDKLFGCHWVRDALLDGEPPARIVDRWAASVAGFRRTRRRHLLYAP